ncbi:hypothetical protein J6590_055337 [Homalodisca vitripennis]|nr:hypothetical protein J6590_055337 [Homalodisca vitripennis]
MDFDGEGLTTVKEGSKGSRKRQKSENLREKSKEEYLNVYRMFGTVRVLGQDWFIKDAKSLATVYKNLTNTSSFKRIEICNKNTDTPNQTRILVQGQTFLRFNEEVTAVTLLKRGFSSKKGREFILQVAPLPWRECETCPQRQWYVDIIDSQDVTEPTKSCEELCDCLEDDEDVHI